MSNLMFPFQMTGHLMDAGGAVLQRGGFMPVAIPPQGFTIAPSEFDVRRSEDMAQLSPDLQRDLLELAPMLQRGEFTGDLNQVVGRLAEQMEALQRGITTSNTAFPVRENLEPYAATLVPTDTPLRNRLPRKAGSGRAAAWKQLVSLGGGWGSTWNQPGGSTVQRMFYQETGAPVEHTSVYADKLAAYKLLGTLGSVSGFAMAAGATYQDQLGKEKQNGLSNLMLNEELALHYGDSTSALVPWGDGTTPMSFDGLWTLIATANGTPSAQVQTAVGALTTDHIDAQLTRITDNGGDGLYIELNSQEARSLVTLLQRTGAINRFAISDAGNATMGFRVAKYIHPTSGKEVDISVSRFMKPGDMIFGATTLPDGSPAAEVEVLPQVPTPLAPELPQEIQGYVVTELARTTTSPDVRPFLISIYETLKMRAATVFGKSTGVLPS